MPLARLSHWNPPTLPLANPPSWNRDWADEHCSSAHAILPSTRCHSLRSSLPPFAIASFIRYRSFPPPHCGAAARAVAARKRRARHAVRPSVRPSVSPSALLSPSSVRPPSPTVASHRDVELLPQAFELPHDAVHKFLLTHRATAFCSWCAVVCSRASAVVALRASATADLGILFVGRSRCGNFFPVLVASRYENCFLSL